MSEAQALVEKSTLVDLALVQRQEQESAGVSSEDLMIPKLLLMQNTSELVGDGKAKLGDVWNSEQGKVVASIEKPIEVVPLRMYKTWRIMDMSGQMAEYLREIPVTPDNVNWEWEGTEVNEEGKEIPIRRDFTFNLIALVKSEIASGDDSPVLIPFRRTSARTGNAIASHMYKRTLVNKASYGKSILLTVSKQKFEQNTYAVMTMSVGDQMEESYCEVSKRWLSALAVKNVVIEEDREVEKPAAATAPIVVGASVSTGEQGPY